MATRSFIIRQSNLPGTPRYTGIYCHWDGYPQYVGVMLRDHYSHDGEVQVLLGRGDISSLLTPGGCDLGGNDGEWKEYGEMAVQMDFLGDMLSHADGMGCEHAYVWVASKREWEHYDLRRNPNQSLHGVESVVELAQREAGITDAEYWEVIARLRGDGGI